MRFRLYAAVSIAVAAILLSREIRAQKKDDAPQIEKKSGDEILVLPELLNECIRKLLPGFRVPESKDRTGLWDQDTDAGNMPYAVWGDLSGGGRTDIALILLGNREWRLAIFHQTETGYVLAYSQGSKTKGPEAQVSSPQILSLKLIPKDKPYIYTTISNSSGRDEKQFTFKTDAIEFAASEQFLGLLYWKDGKYKTIDFSD